MPRQGPPVPLVFTAPAVARAYPLDGHGDVANLLGPVLEAAA
jgi:hypothetical protein